MPEHATTLQGLTARVADLEAELAAARRRATAHALAQTTTPDASDLKRAIPAGEIEPWFQPVVDARAGRTVGVEVLARWRHPHRGLLLPAAFVPLAEDAGLIGALDAAVFDQACEITAPWVAEGWIAAVSCNVSPRDLTDPAFSRKLIARLARTRLPPEALTVEITETFLLQDLALARRHIERLAARGVRVALDDFGIGYSNLRALIGLPIHTVKLDRTLIAGVGRDPRVSRLVAALLHAARALDVRIVAEGVEEEAQAIFLRAAGCERMQGFWFARPMPQAEMARCLQTEVESARELEAEALPAAKRRAAI